MENKTKGKLSRLGPGFIVAATTVGAGSVVSYTNAGANYGFNLVWWLVILAVSLFGYNYVMKKYTAASGNTIIDGIIKNYGRPWAIVSGVAAFIGQTIFGIGNFIAVSLGFQMLFPGMPFKVGGFIGLICCILMYIMKNIYKKVELVTKACSIVMVAIFIISLVVTGGTVGVKDVVSTSVIGMPAGSFLVMLSLMGTSCSLSTQAWSCNLAKQKGYSSKNIDNGDIRMDTIAQVVVVVGVSACCLFIGAMLLPSSPIANGSDLVSALAGLLGSWIRPVFGIGFLAAAWSSQIMAPQIGVNLLFDAIGSNRENERLENIINILMLVFAAIIACIVGGVPANMLTIAQLGGVVNTPILGIFAILLANNVNDMKEYRIKKPYTVMLVILYIIQVVIIINTLVSIIGG